MEFSPVESASSDLAATISKRLYEWTNRRWVVAISSDKGQATLREKAEAAKAEKLDDVRTHPLVKAALATFPGAEIIEVRDGLALPLDTLNDAKDDADFSDESFDFTSLDHDDA